MILLLLACQSPIDTGTDDPAWAATDADCPSGGLVTLDRLGEPLSVSLCDVPAAYCQPVGYGLTDITLTVVCGNGGLVRVVWGLE